MFRYIVYIILAGSCLEQGIIAQDTIPKKLTLDGYVSFMQSAMDINIPGVKLLWESLVHNRMNLNYYPSAALSFSLQVRTRIIWGDRMRIDNENVYKNTLAKDMGVVDMSVNYLSGKSYVVNTAVDRFWIKYAVKKLEITAGRQRINWGQTFVWNPNDWFNNYSFFDVDYVERPGSDALRIQYYTSAISGMEAVVKFDSAGNYTAAGRFKTNIRQYDLQFLGGVLAKEDLALGFGWAGGLGQIGFRGEMTYLHPLKHMNDTSGLFFLSIAFDYSFANSLMIQVEGLFNQLTTGSGGESFTQFYGRPLSVKDMSFTKVNLCAQVSYPFNPLLNGSLAILYFPDIKGYYAGPAVTWSVVNNLDLSLFVQYFNGRFPGESATSDRLDFTIGYLRVKYNF